MDCFSSCIETEGLLQGHACSHVDRESGNVWKMVQDRDAVTTGIDI